MEPWSSPIAAPLPEFEASVPLPIACALAGDALGARWQRWRALVARAGTGVLDVPDGVELSFTPDAATELTSLVEAEQACCAWATWSLTSSDGDLVLAATAPDDAGTGALRAFFRD